MATMINTIKHSATQFFKMVLLELCVTFAVVLNLQSVYCAFAFSSGPND